MDAGGVAHILHGLLHGDIDGIAEYDVNLLLDVSLNSGHALFVVVFIHRVHRSPPAFPGEFLDGHPDIKIAAGRFQQHYGDGVLLFARGARSVPSISVAGSQTDNKENRRDGRDYPFSILHFLLLNKMRAICNGADGHIFIIDWSKKQSLFYKSSLLNNKDIKIAKVSFSKSDPA
jgi:hypothetical protein